MPTKKRKGEFGPDPHATTEDVRKLIAKFVINSNQSLSIVEHPDFKKLVHGISNGAHTSITRNTLVSDIDKIYTGTTIIISLKIV